MEAASEAAAAAFLRRRRRRERERKRDKEREREREQKMPGGEKNSSESSKKLESRRTDFLSAFLSRSVGLNSQVYVDTQKTS